MASLALTSLLESTLHFVNSSYPNITPSKLRSLVELVEDRVKLSLQLLKYLPKRFYNDQRLKLLEEKLRIAACEAEYSMEERKHDETLSEIEMLSRCDDIDLLNTDLLKTLMPDIFNQEPLPYVVTLYAAEKPKFCFCCIRSKSSKVEKNEIVDFLAAISTLPSDSGSDMESRIVVRCDYFRMENWFQIRDWVDDLQNLEDEVEDSLEDMSHKTNGSYTLRMTGMSFEEVCECLCHRLLDHSYFIVMHNHVIRQRGSDYLLKDNKNDFWISNTNFKTTFDLLVFGERSCPEELEIMANNISNRCRGSSFVFFMVAKYLSKINPTTHNWLIVLQSIHNNANMFHDKNYSIISALIKASEVIDSIYAEETGISFEKRKIRNNQAEIFERLEASSEGYEAEDEKVEIDEYLDKLIPELLQSSPQLEKVAIVGLGGIGKTTLAKQIFDHASVSSHFHIRAWIDISQFYQKRNLLIQLLQGISHLTDDEILNRTDAQLEKEVYKCLKGQRYFIIMDDMWKVEAWSELERIVPDDILGSRILLTSRSSYLIENLTCKIVHRMSLLSENKSWELLQKKVFGHEICPQGLLDIGKYIARECEGLPLSIVVVAGILSNINKTADCWEVVAESVSSHVIGREATRAIFALSYEHLPDYLKSCFLYMAAFPEGYEIEVRILIRSWIAEGFIHNAPLECLEDVAEECLHDLINRNLVLRGRRRSNGKFKTCRIHSLVLSFCVREARERKLFSPLGHQLILNL